MQVPRFDPSRSSPRVYNFLKNMRVTVLTVTVVGIIGLLIDGYINNSFDTSRFLLIGIFAWNAIYSYLNKPVNPNLPIPNEQTARETTETK